MSDYRRQTDAFLDAAIDEAVGEMMHVEGAPDARARVLSRLEERPTPLLTTPRLLGAIALAAVLVLAFALTRGPAPTPMPEDVARTAPLPPVHSAPDREMPDVPPLRVEVPDNGRRSPTTDDAPAAGFTSTIAIAPLRQIDPIVVSPLQPSPVRPDDIAIPPLAPIAELEIEPLFPSDGRI